MNTYRVMKPIWTTTQHKTPTGEPLWLLNFIPAGERITAMTDEQAIGSARQLGVTCPVLQKEN